MDGTAYTVLPTQPTYYFQNGSVAITTSYSGSSTANSHSVTKDTDTVKVGGTGFDSAGRPVSQETVTIHLGS